MASKLMFFLSFNVAQQEGLSRHVIRQWKHTQLSTRPPPGVRDQQGRPDWSLGSPNIKRIVGVISYFTLTRWRHLETPSFRTE